MQTLYVLLADKLQQLQKSSISSVDLTEYSSPPATMVQIVDRTVTVPTTAATAQSIWLEEPRGDVADEHFIDFAGHVEQIKLTSTTWWGQQGQRTHTGSFAPHRPLATGNESHVCGQHRNLLNNGQPRNDGTMWSKNIGSTFHVSSPRPSTKTRVSNTFTARRYSSALYAVALYPSVNSSIHPPVTIRYCTKIAKRRIKQTPHNSSGPLVFRSKWRQRRIDHRDKFPCNICRNS